MEGAADASAARKAEQYQVARHAVERDAETRLVRLLGGELRRHQDVLDLLIGLEEDGARGGAAGLESVAREANRPHEYLFRRLAAEYPQPDQPSWAAGRWTAHAGTGSETLALAVTTLGLDELPTGLCRSYAATPCKYHEHPRERGRAASSEEHGFINQLVPLAVIAAADTRSPHRFSHPLRELSQHAIGRAEERAPMVRQAGGRELLAGSARGASSDCLTSR